MKLIAVGDNVCDCYLDEGVFFPGGNCVNVAVHAKRSGAQSVNYTGVLGNDRMAQHILDCLAAEGVETSNCRRVFAPTSQPGVKLVDGERIFVGGNPQSCQRIVAMKMTKSDLDLAKQYDVCHISCYSNMENELEALSGAVPLSFDFSDIRDEKYFAKTAPYLTWAFLSGAQLSETECETLALQIAQLGAKNVCITRGAQGSLFFDGENFYRQGIMQVDAVDTMGAGDSFIAAFLVRYTDTGDISGALSFAAQKAAYNCTQRGAIGYAGSLFAK